MLVVLAAPAGTRKASGTAICATHSEGLTVRAGVDPGGAIRTPGWAHIEQARGGPGAPTCSPWDAEHELESESPVCWDRCSPGQGRWSGSLSLEEDACNPETQG